MHILNITTKLNKPRQALQKESSYNLYLTANKVYVHSNILSQGRQSLKTMRWQEFQGCSF